MLQIVTEVVEEETGLTHVELGELIGISTHYYNERGINIKKETHWYAMKANSKQPLIPQAEEQISELKWVSQEELPFYFSNTYQNVIEIVQQYFKKKPAD